MNPVKSNESSNSSNLQLPYDPNDEEYKKLFNLTMNDDNKQLQQSLNVTPILSINENDSPNFGEFDHDFNLPDDRDFRDYRVYRSVKSIPKPQLNSTNQLPVTPPPTVMSELEDVLPSPQGTTPLSHPEGQDKFRSYKFNMTNIGNNYNTNNLVQQTPTIENIKNNENVTHFNHINNNTNEISHVQTDVAAMDYYKMGDHDNHKVFRSIQNPIFSQLSQPYNSPSIFTEKREHPSPNFVNPMNIQRYYTSPPYAQNHHLNVTEADVQTDAQSRTAQKHLQAEMLKTKQTLIKKIQDKETENGKKKVENDMLKERVEKSKQSLLLAEKEEAQTIEQLKTERDAYMSLFNSGEDESKRKQCKKYFEKNIERLQKIIDEITKKCNTTSNAVDSAQNEYENRMQNILHKLKQLEAERQKRQKENVDYELQMIQLQDSINKSKEELESYRHQNYSKTNPVEINSSVIDNNEKNKKNKTYISPEELEKARAQVIQYPSHSETQGNLIRAQMEFYCSDYNLKRDKRLLELMCKSPVKGYLHIDEVLSLTRIRPLCNDRKQLIECLKPSICIDICQHFENTSRGSHNDHIHHQGYHDNDNSNRDDGYLSFYIGRKNFTPPAEKLFPFRRSVFVYGLPLQADTKFIEEMLTPFGTVTKTAFDHGPDTLDRAIMKKLLDKNRAFQLMSQDNLMEPLLYSTKSVNRGNEFSCVKCKKNKKYSDGCYYKHSNRQYIMCLQCAANCAEELIDKYEEICKKNENAHHDNHLKQQHLGSSRTPNHTQDVTHCLKTALCVFASQRQASKCVYVRSRLSFEGAFATHYHHYSKIKKDIAISMKPKTEAFSNFENDNENTKL